MTKHVPPVPPANQNRRGGKSHEAPDIERQGAKPGERNLEQQGRQGNIHENTHHQGHQQDR
jgi:hypothetical protein